MQGHAHLLSRLEEHFHASTGGACVVSGSPGSGKTHLAASFLDQLPDSTSRLYSCGRATEDLPFRPFYEALHSPEGVRNLDQLIAVSEELAKSIPMFSEFVAPLLRARERTRDVPAALSTSMPSGLSIFFALERVFEAIKPLVLVVDDMQWLDASTVAFLKYFAGKLREHEVFLLLTRRTNGRIPEPTQRLLEALRRDTGEALVELHVDGLSSPELRQLVESELGKTALSPEQLRWLESTSRRKPFYVAELIGLLRHRNLLVRDGGAWTLREPLDSTILPPALERHALERLRSAAESSSSAQRVIRLAACLGTRFDARLLAAALDCPPLEVFEALNTVELRTSLVRRVAKTSEYAFDHDITREVILGDLGDFARELHGQLAEAMVARGDVPPSTVAFQFEAAEQAGPAARSYLEAARLAEHKAQFHAALDYAQAADRLFESMGVEPSHGDRVATATSMGAALFGSERYEEAVELLDDRVRRFPEYETPSVLHLLGRAEARVADAPSYRRSVVHLREAADALPAEADAERARVLVDLVNAYEACEQFEDSKAAFLRAFHLARRAEDRPTLLRLMRQSCIFWEPEKVVETITEAIAEATRLGLDYERALCENNLGSAYLALRELAEARIHYKTADAILFKQGGHRRDSPINNLALIDLFERELEPARRGFEEALRISRDPHTALFIESNLGALEWELDEREAALARLERTLARAEATGDGFYRDCVGHNLAHALTEDGRPKAALALLDATPLHVSHGEGLLVAGKRAELRGRALEALGRPVPEELRRQAAALARSTRPQAWLYREPWYLCESEFWED